MQPFPYPPNAQPMISYRPQPVKRRNPALIAVGAVLLLIALAAFAIFAYNAWQYSTADEKLGGIQGAEWVVDLVKKASLSRMTVFGSISAVFGLAGVVLEFFGLRKR